MEENKIYKKFYGEKNLKIVRDFIEPNLPKHFTKWIEPFGGSLTAKNLSFKPDEVIYNDINHYEDRIDEIRQFSSEVHHLDYIDIIREYDNPDVLFYCDPPYYSKENLYKGCIRNDSDFHKNFKEVMIDIVGKFIISYEDCKFIRNLWEKVPGITIVKFDTSERSLKNEILIKNF